MAAAGDRATDSLQKEIERIPEGQLRAALTHTFLTPAAAKPSPTTAAARGGAAAPSPATSAADASSDAATASTSSALTFPFARALGTYRPTTSLELGGCRLGAEGARQLAAVLRLRGARTLRHLGLRGCNLTDLGADVDALGELLFALEAHGQLLSLDLSQNTIHAAGARLLARLLPSLPNLRFLDVSRANLRSEGVAALAVALDSRALTAARELLARGGGDGLGTASFADTTAAASDTADSAEDGEGGGGDGITPTSTPITPTPVSTCGTPALLTLNLAENNASNFEESELGGLALAFALRAHPTLTHLDLSHNRLLRRTLRALADALTTNTMLSDLRLDDNRRVGPREAERFASVLLAHNRSLTRLSLRDCAVFGDGAAALARVIHRDTGNGVLAALDVRNNTVARFGRLRLVEALFPGTPAVRAELKRVGDEGDAADGGADADGGAGGDAEPEVDGRGAGVGGVAVGGAEESKVVDDADEAKARVTRGGGGGGGGGAGGEGAAGGGGEGDGDDAGLTAAEAAGVGGGSAKAAKKEGKKEKKPKKVKKFVKLSSGWGGLKPDAAKKRQNWSDTESEEEEEEEEEDDDEEDDEEEGEEEGSGSGGEKAVGAAAEGRARVRPPALDGSAVAAAGSESDEEEDARVGKKTPGSRGRTPSSGAARTSFKQGGGGGGGAGDGSESEGDEEARGPRRRRGRRGTGSKRGGGGGAEEDDEEAALIRGQRARADRAVAVPETNWVEKTSILTREVVERWAPDATADLDLESGDHALLLPEQGKVVLM